MRAMLAVLACGCYAPNPSTGAPCPDNICPSGLVCSQATHTCERSNVDRDAGGDAVDARVDAGIDAPPPTFRYRRRITIYNNTNTALPAGLTIHYPLNNMLAMLVSQGKAKADFSDVRIVGDAVGERNRIIDLAPAPSAVSFSLAQSIGAAGMSMEYALYYGAPGAGPPPANGAAVFQLYDDFNSGIASVWLKNDQ